MLKNRTNEVAKELRKKKFFYIDLTDADGREHEFTVSSENGWHTVKHEIDSSLEYKMRFDDLKSAVAELVRRYDNEELKFFGAIEAETLNRRYA